MTLYRRLIRKVHRLQDRLHELRGPGDASAIGNIDVAHSMARLESAERSDDPSPHIYIERLFSEVDYARILDALPSSDLTFDYWMDRDADPTKGAHGEYRKRYDLDLRKAEARIPGPTGQFWGAMHATLTAKPFVRALMDRYADVLAPRYGNGLSDTEFDQRIGVDAFLMRHEPNYYLGPHTDRHDRVVTVVIYLPRDDHFPELGTSFFVPRGVVNESGERRHHHGFDKFDAVKTMRYVPNTAVLFPQTDTGFHGVLPINQDRRVAVRYGMQIQVFDRLARAGTTASY